MKFRLLLVSVVMLVCVSLSWVGAQATNSDPPIEMPTTVEMDLELYVTFSGDVISRLVDSNVAKKIPHLPSLMRKADIYEYYFNYLHAYSKYVSYCINFNFLRKADHLNTRYNLAYETSWFSS